MREGRLDLDQPVALPECGATGDPRRAITLRQLLRMESGLGFAGSYTNPLGDVLWMLFRNERCRGVRGAQAARVPAGRRLVVLERHDERHQPSGAAGRRRGRLPTFPRRALFDPLGMRSAIVEPDASGTFVGSSLMFATARDWARFGRLYLDDGVSQGRRLLPDGWVAFSTEPAPAAPNAVYGAHFWRRLSPSGEDGLPADTYHAVGHEGQFVSVLPSRGIVVVRLGLSIGRGSWDHAAFLRRVIDAVARDQG